METEEKEAIIWAAGREKAKTRYSVLLDLPNELVLLLTRRVVCVCVCVRVCVCLIGHRLVRTTSSS